MSDALPLPPRPNIAQYRKLARDYQQACNTHDPAAVRRWAVRWAEALARLRGVADPAGARRKIDEDAARIDRQLRSIRMCDAMDEPCTLARAQFAVARCHGFASWPGFAQHVKAIARPDSAVSQFETAADAIVAGDIETLKNLLRANPDLVRERSTRDHRSTLLHYVPANGVEDFRQKTPRNIVAIAALLLDAGSDVNAESGAYGGGSTALALAATSCHPEAAGVQIALLDLLIARGAAIDNSPARSTLAACLHNGRGQAAEFLAARGARIDLEGAAGIGRLDLVKDWFDDAGLKPDAAREQLTGAFTFACEFGRKEVVEFLLEHGLTAQTRLRDGATGLHWAALEGHADLVALLLQRGGRVDAVEEVYGGTPLGWALYGWGAKAPAERQRRSYYETVALLVRAGAPAAPAAREAAGRRDARMQAALRGEAQEEL